MRQRDRVPAIKAMIAGPCRQYRVGSIDGPALELTKITKPEKLFHRRLIEDHRAREN